MKSDDWLVLGLALLGGALLGAWLVVTVLGKTQSTTYQNLEEWTLKRDYSGRLVGVGVHRKAEQNG